MTRTTGIVIDVFVLLRIVLAISVTCMLLVATTSATASGASRNQRITISYADPQQSEFLEIAEWVKERRTLERLQEFLSPYRLPRTLKVTIRGCDGEADAFYEDYVITICYEYFEALMNNAPEETTPAGIEPHDTVIGPFVDTSLHEFAHALFDMLKLPVLGREEDAADHVAAYIYLQLGYEESRRLIMGTAWAYLTEATRAGLPDTLKQYADEHGTPAQRAYNVLCMAYGAEPALFADFVSKGYLPEKRAMACEEEYELVQDAYEALIGPHIDQDLAKEVFHRTWLQQK